MGILPEDNEPVTLIFPKLRIQKGFSLAFTTNQYANMPYEFTPFDLVPADVHYDTFKNIGCAMMLGGN